MGKDKLKRFEECKSFDCLIQAEFDEIFGKDYKLKGNWGRDFFKNDNPIVLELGCGRGEYTVNLAQRYPNINFIGIDIKGARLWRGAKTATENAMNNIGFIRTRIEFINSFFSQNEVSEIWVTFPDPQLKKNRIKKRLTGNLFLEYYSQFLKPEGKVHLKTDSLHLHRYTRELCEHNNIDIEFVSEDIYNDERIGAESDLTTIRTTYESKFLKEGYKITYIKFSLGDKQKFEAIEFADDELL